MNAVLLPVIEKLKNPEPRQLTWEEAVAYCVWALDQADCYGSGLIESLSESFPDFRVSTTVLWRVLYFLTTEGFARTYERKITGRGRPQVVYQLIPGHRKDLEVLVDLWGEVVSRG